MVALFCHYYYYSLIYEWNGFQSPHYFLYILCYHTVFQTRLSSVCWSRLTAMLARHSPHSLSLGSCNTVIHVHIPSIGRTRVTHGRQAAVGNSVNGLRDSFLFSSSSITNILSSTAWHTFSLLFFSSSRYSKRANGVCVYMCVFRVRSLELQFHTLFSALRNFHKIKNKVRKRNHPL